MCPSRCRFKEFYPNDYPRYARFAMLLANVDPKLVVNASYSRREFGVGHSEMGTLPAAWLEHLVSVRQRTHSRDLSTPPQSPAPRDSSESVEMTGYGDHLWQ